MSVPDKSIDPRLLKSAKEVFLDKGFEMAQLSEICKKAGVTTGALYKRYAGKEELFCEVVSDTIEALDNYVSKIKNSDLSSFSDQDLFDGFHMNPEVNLRWLKYLYEHKEGFILLIARSEGTRYTHFHEDWTERMNKIHYQFYLEAKRRGLTSKNVSEKEMNVLTTTVWSMFFKPFMLDFTWKEIEEHAETMSKFIDWYEALGIEK